MPTVFDIEGELNPGTWFELDGGGQICVRICAGEDLRAIRRKTVKKRVEYKNGGRFIVEDTNEDLENELLWDFCIVDWKNLFDAKGNEIPCTTENKVRLMGKSIQFSKFIRDCIDKLTEFDREVAEAESKN